LQAFPDLGAGAIAKAMGKSVDDDESSGARLQKEMSKQLLALPYHEAKDRVLESFEKTYLLEHLRAANGVVTRAAQRAGLPRQSVHRMLRRLGINTADE
jgi:transcriptional regulator of acetoin/glycerol metabolism